MNTAVKLSAYGVVLALVAGGAWAVGTAVGPLPAGPAGHTHAPTGTTSTAGTDSTAEAGYGH